jgi:hypothetical protein
MTERNTPPGPRVSSSSAATGNRPAQSVERLFPFVLRSGILMIGRDSLSRSKRKLHFVLITEDISEAARRKILEDFKHYPVVQRYESADLERHFGIKGAKTVGFAKSDLAKSVYAEMKAHRINPPLIPASQTGHSNSNP